WDHFARLFITSRKLGRVWAIPRPGEKPVLLAEGMQSAADLCYDPANKRILVPDMMAGALYALPATVPSQEVNDSPPPLETALAFPDLKFAGWHPSNERGQLTPLRPLVLTHPGDGSNRIVLATQRGVIHVFPNDPKAKEAKVFLDLEK